MRVKYFYTWGYFHPVTCGADQVAVNHFAYFRERGWDVDFILANNVNKRAYAQHFREAYPWVDSITEVELPPHEWGFRDLLFAYEHAAKAPRVRAALAEPADLFFTNYVFTTPLLDHLPRSCKRVLETVDVMTNQFAIAEEQVHAAQRGPSDPLAPARKAFWHRVELELYELYDAVIMINPDELRFVKSQTQVRAVYVPQMYTSVTAESAARRQNFDFDLIFVGSEAPINTRGITWFYQHVYVPYLWRRGVRLAIVGGASQFLDVHDAHITRFGRVEGSLEPLYAASKLGVVPIFEGTGLSTKTLEGLSMGVPMVVAPLGARGLDDPDNGCVKIDMKAAPRRTAEVILHLLRDDRRRAELRRSALAYIRRCFSREAYFRAMDQALAQAGLEVAAKPTGLPGTPGHAVPIRLANVG